MQRQSCLALMYLGLVVSVVISLNVAWNTRQSRIRAGKASVLPGGGLEEKERDNVKTDPATDLTAPDTEQRRVRPWVILATTNSAFLDFTQNWLESLKRCGIHDHVTIIAEDTAARDALHNLTGVKLDIILTKKNNLPTKLLQFGSTNYLKLVNKRPAYIRHFLKKGVDVLFSDVDTVWLQNPLPYLVGDFDIHFQRDIHDDPTRPDMMCAGFAYYSATNATIGFINRWMQQIRTRPHIPDQQLLNQLLRQRIIRNVLRINYLDSRQFLNGKDFFNETSRIDVGDVKPVMVHNNWIKGHDIKVERFKHVSMWYLN